MHECVDKWRTSSISKCNEYSGTILIKVITMQMFRDTLLLSIYSFLFLFRFYSLMISLFSSHSWLFLWPARTRTERQTQFDDVLQFSFVYYDVLFCKTKAQTDVEELRERTKQRNQMKCVLRESWMQRNNSSLYFNDKFSIIYIC